LNTAESQLISFSSLLGRWFLMLPNWFYASVACLVIGAYAVTLTPTGDDDFKIYYQAAVSINRVGEPYSQSPSYIYPPLLAYLVRPLTALPQVRAQQLWFAGNVVLLGVFFVLCIRHLAPELLYKRWGTLGLALVLAPPTRICLQIGQLGILIAVLLLGLYVLERRTPLAALCLALASLLKLYPALFGLLALRRHSWRLVMWTALLALGILGLSMAFYGIQPYVYYVSHPFPQSVFPAQAEFNISLYGLWSRLFTENVFAASVGHSPALVAGLTSITTLVVLAACNWVTYAGGSALYQQTLYSLWITTMLLISPINGYYNLVILLVPALAVARHLIEAPNLVLRMACLVATALIFIPPGWTNTIPWLYSALHTHWGILLLTPSVYGLLIYLALLVKLARDSAPRAKQFSTML
jgi:hypothetical protein